MQSGNREAKHFSYNFKTKNAGDVLNFLLELLGNKNKDIEFVNGNKKFPIINFSIEFLA